MVRLQLRSTDYHVTRDEHAYNFDIVDTAHKTTLGSVRVIAAKVEGGLDAMQHRANGNLVTILEQALEDAKRHQELSAKRVQPTP